MMALLLSSITGLTEFKDISVDLPIVKPQACTAIAISSKLCIRSNVGFEFLRERNMATVGSQFVSVSYSGKIALAVLGIKQALDSVWHKRLLSELKQMGTSEYLWQWCKQFLNARKSLAEVNSFTSKPSNCERNLHKDLQWVRYCTFYIPVILYHLYRCTHEATGLLMTQLFALALHQYEDCRFVCKKQSMPFLVGVECVSWNYKERRRS